MLQAPTNHEYVVIAPDTAGARGNVLRGSRGDLNPRADGSKPLNTATGRNAHGKKRKGRKPSTSTTSSDVMAKPQCTPAQLDDSVAQSGGSPVAQDAGGQGEGGVPEERA